MRRPTPSLPGIAGRKTRVNAHDGLATSAAALERRTLAKTPHLYEIGPIEEPSLARVGPNGAVRVAETFEAGVPFFVWGEIPVWQRSAGVAGAASSTSSRRS